MAKFIFFAILGTLFIIVCIIGVVALYFALKGWVLEEFDIVLPPKANEQKSYWETLEISVVPTYVCNACTYNSDKKYRHCPWCGIEMGNHSEKWRNYGSEVRM